MIMGLFGGTIFPLAMSMASDGIGSQLGAVAVMLVAAATAFLCIQNSRENADCQSVSRRTQCQEIRQRFAQRGLQGLIDELPYLTGTVQVSVDTED